MESITWFWNLDRTVRSDRENFEPFIFAVLLVSRTALWEKCRDPCDPRSDLMVLRTVIKPFLTVPCFPLNLNLKKKKKNTEKQKKKKHNCWEYIMSSETLPLPSPEKQSMSLCFFFFFFSLQRTSRSSLHSKTLLFGESSFKFWLYSPPVMCVWQGESLREREWERES